MEEVRNMDKLLPNYKAYNELLSSKPLLHETSLDLTQVLSGIKMGPFAKVIQKQVMIADPNGFGSARSRANTS